MKKIRSYTSIWNVEKVLYAINDVNLPFPVTFTQITWFVLTEFIIILFADVPPLSMIEGAFLKYFGIPVRVYDEKLCEAIKKLSERRRNVVLMFYFLELPDAEIAEILDISRNSVYRNRMCSLKLIRDMYEEEL